MPLYSGNAFTGQVKTQSAQWIETELFWFIIPLYAVSAMFVSDVDARGRVGFGIKINKTSAIAAFVRPVFFLLSIFSVGAYIGNFDIMPWLMIPAVLSTALFVYFARYFGKTTKKEQFVRKQFGELLGYYFMPQWLLPHSLSVHFDNLKRVYTTSFGTIDWKERLRNTQYYDEGFQLFFCLTSLENCINYKADTEKMLNEIAIQNLDK
jgi:hypothetical protein